MLYNYKWRICDDVIDSRDMLDYIEKHKNNEDYKEEVEALQKVVNEYCDDYEEGLYSVAITGATSGSWTLHSDHNQLAYTKIGRMVTVIGKYETSSGSGSGSLRFSLPFTPAQLGNSGGVAAGSISVNRVGSGNNITSSMTAIAFENLKFIYVQVHNEDASNDESYLNASDIDGAFEGQIGITYFTT